jgi:hypothetical protein
MRDPNTNRDMNADTVPIDAIPILLNHANGGHLVVHVVGPEQSRSSQALVTDYRKVMKLLGLNGHVHCVAAEALSQEDHSKGLQLPVRGAFLADLANCQANPLAMSSTNTGRLSAARAIEIALGNPDTKTLVSILATAFAEHRIEAAYMAGDPAKARRAVHASAVESYTEAVAPIMQRIEATGSLPKVALAA